MTPSDSPTKISPTSIVVADNDILILEVMGELLRAKGFEVHLAHDGLEALQVIRNVKPQFVILDVVMPKLDGSRVCWMIRQDPDLRDTPIIAFSSLSAQDFRHFSDLSADAYVAKDAAPVAFENILQAIAHLQSKGRMDITGGIFGFDKVQPREIVAEMLIERRHYASVLRSLGPGVLELDANSHIVMANSGACEIFGRNESQLVGAPIASMFLPRDQKVLKELLGELMKAVQPEQCTAVLRFGSMDVPVRMCSIIEDAKCTGVLLILESKGVKILSQA
ncbi:MAG TPA: response regulator [Candidatus Methylomirabilis sp.]|nr:response regulator [Candidatus Methylomirabilis sp.]